MDIDLETILKYDLTFLMTNKIGLYLPLLISIYLIIRTKIIEDYKTNIQSIICFTIGTIFCVMLSYSVIEETDFYYSESLYTKNYFGVFYLFWFGLLEKNYNFNLSVVFIGTFFSKLLADFYFAIFVKDISIFSSGIGGAGLFDGLLIDPLFAVLVIFLLKKLIFISLRKQKLKKIIV